MLNHSNKDPIKKYSKTGLTRKPQSLLSDDNNTNKSHITVVADHTNLTVCQLLRYSK